MNEFDKVKIRNGKPLDHQKIISVMPEWWAGRDLSSSVLKVFFIHFRNTVYIAEIDEEIVGFLVGFMSPCEEKVGYIHFAGVHPKHRRAGIGRLLYEKFYAACGAAGRSVVKSCTSPVNKLSINFHRKMGFEIEPGDGMVCGVPVTLNYLGKDDPKVLFKKTMDQRQKSALSGAQCPEAMGQAPNKVAEAYDTVAIEYAEKFCGEHEKKPQDCEILYRFSQEVAGKNPVWDLGCGPGQTTQYLRNSGIEISGLDLSEKMIEQATINHPGITFRKGNMLDLDFKSGSIAGIVAFYAIVHFSQDQLKKAFREIFRVLRPGGVFLFTYHIGEEAVHLDEFLGKAVEIDFMFFKTDFIIVCIKDAGFVDIEIIERDPYPEVEYQSRRAYVFAKKPTAGRGA